MEGRLHALTWLCWALAAAATVQLAPSPVYVALVLAVVVAVVMAHGEDGPLAVAFPALLFLGVAFALLRVVLTVATTHTGGDALLRLPEATLPTVLGGFTVGGGVEVGVLARAAAEGFAVIGLIAAFGAFNAVVSHAELVQATPRAFFEPGLVVTVALAFVPATLEAVGAVREADRARTGGRVVRRGRLVRQCVPILESGLERAVALAESMDTRGFGRGRASAFDRSAGWCGTLALIALAGAFVALVGRAPAAAAALGLAGVLSLGAAVALASRSSGRSRYRRRPLTATDRAVAVAVLLAPAGVALLAATGDDSLRWVADPLHVPKVSLGAVLAVAALAAPLLDRRPTTAEPEPAPDPAEPFRRQKVSP